MKSMARQRIEEEDAYVCRVSIWILCDCNVCNTCCFLVYQICVMFKRRAGSLDIFALFISFSACIFFKKSLVCDTKSAFKYSSLFVRLFICSASSVVVHTWNPRRRKRRPTDMTRNSYDDYTIASPKPEQNGGNSSRRVSWFLLHESLLIVVCLREYVESLVHVCAAAVEVWIFRLNRI